MQSGLNTYHLGSALFSKALACIYLIAFVSLGLQVKGLIGSQGILPAGEYLRGDFALQAVCGAGAALAVAAALLPAHGIAQRTCFSLLYAGYLFLVTAGQIFMGYQWDFLLLEAGFLTIFLTPVYSRVWLFQWLLFRLMFESGAAKLLSHDPSWKGLTALSFHWETQPLPLPLAWYLNQSPLWLEKASAVFVFAVELTAPFLILAPRPFRYTAAAAITLLQVLILLTGNYTFFNLLTIALCLLLLDDALLGRFFAIPRKVTVRANRYVSAALFVAVMTLSCAEVLSLFGHPAPAFLRTLESRAAPFGIVNSYGLFASMTTARLEISVEGSNDGTNWLVYEFRYKPGPLNRAPVFAAPHQPRLDWQMWFAALGSAGDNPWFTQFLFRLLEASPPVLALLENDPFHGHPPLYVRALACQYRFTSRAERSRTGAWWQREPKGMYFPAISLKDFAVR